MIALCGDPRDLTTAYVGLQASRRGIEVAELDETLLGESWALDFDDDAPAAARLEHGGRPVGLDELHGIFVRFNPRPGVPAALAGMPGELSATLREERRAGLDYVLDRLPCTVVNRPSTGRANGSKPLQMRQLGAAGFDVPTWIVASEPEEARAFVAGCALGAIYKTASGLRSQVRRADAELFAALAASGPPAVVQEYVPGDDMRVHTVAERVFATRIAGAGLDYRYEATGANYMAAEPPDAIAARCVQFARSEGLLLAGFDFRIDPGGRWHCLEVNPVPTFLPYEMTTGQPIAAAVITALERR